MKLDEVLLSDEFLQFNEQGLKVDQSNSYDNISEGIKNYKLHKGKQDKSSGDYNDNGDSRSNKLES